MNTLNTQGELSSNKRLSLTGLIYKNQAFFLTLIKNKIHISLATNNNPQIPQQSSKQYH